MTNNFDERAMRRVCADIMREDAEAHSTSMRAEAGRAQAYLAGLNRRVPTEWHYRYQDTVKQAEREADPEWTEYERLRRKFEAQS